MFFNQPLPRPLFPPALLPLLLGRVLLVPLLLPALLLLVLLLLVLRCSCRYSCSKSVLYTGDAALLRVFCKFAIASSGTLAMNPAPQQNCRPVASEWHRKTRSSAQYSTCLILPALPRFFTANT